MLCNTWSTPSVHSTEANFIIMAISSKVCVQCSVLRRWKITPDVRAFERDDMNAKHSVFQSHDFISVYWHKKKIEQKVTKTVIYLKSFNNTEPVSWPTSWQKCNFQFNPAVMFPVFLAVTESKFWKALCGYLITVCQHWSREIP